jgi:diadenosine tetraphosphate (Ap4A) HIT family hydrolase
MTPHLHWHVIPRYRGDPHFPQPIWSAAVRSPASAAGACEDFRAALVDKLGCL